MTGIRTAGKTTSVISYDLNGGSLNGQTGTVTVEAENGSTIVLPAPTREGYTFDYWQGSRYNAGDKYTVKEDHTFTAQWKQDEKDNDKDDEDKDDKKDDPGKDKSDGNDKSKDKDKPGGNDKSDEKDKSAKTGDDSLLLFWFIAVAAGTLVLIAVALKRRRA